MPKNELSAREQARQKVAQMQKSEKRSSLLSNKLFIVVSVFVILSVFVATLLFIGQNKQDAAKKDIAAYQVTPEKVDAKGAFQVDSEKAKNNPNAIRVDSFFDPQCPGCGSLDRAIGEMLKEKSEAGEIDLYYTPVSFLDNASRDKYSSRATNAVIEVAENSPENLVEFVNAIYSANFQPAEGGETRSTEEIKNLAVSVGVPENVANDFEKMAYNDWIKTHSEEQTARTDLFPEGFSTPALFLETDYSNPESVDYTKVDFTGGDMKEQFEKAYEKAVKEKN